jgi:membrane protease YdiL (CAAX protease family)
MHAEIETAPYSRALWRLVGQSLLRIVIGIVIVNVGTFVVRSLVQAALSALAVEQSAVRITLVFVARFLTVYFGYVLFVRIFEKRKADELTVDRRSLTQFALGSALGLASISLVVVSLWMIGSFSIVTVNHSPTLLEDVLFHSFFAFIQDVVFVAILFRILERALGTWTSMVASSAIFGFQHLLYPGQTLWSASAQTIEAGILFCAMYVLTRRIWLIVGFHVVWNFIQYALIGFPVMEHSRPLLQSQFSGSNIVTGVPVGLEASLLTLIVGTGLGLILLRKGILLQRFVRPVWKTMSERRAT